MSQSPTATTAALPIAVTFDTDCDGLGIEICDLEHGDRATDPEFRLSYGVKPEDADDYISRESFDREVFPLLTKHSRGFWKREGFASVFLGRNASGWGTPEGYNREAGAALGRLLESKSGTRS